MTAPRAPGERPTRPWSGVRARSALAAVVVVAIALVTGAVLLLTILQRNLIGGVQQAAQSRANEVAQQLVDEGPSSLVADLRADAQEGHVVQVLDGSGLVVASSSDRTGDAPLTTLRPRAGGELQSSVSRLELLEQERPYLVVARGVAHEGQTFTVVVATSVAAERESVRTVLSLLLLGLPVLLALAGWATWVLVSRSLRPVERIRARVAGIGGSPLDERVPVPPTGDEIARLASTMNEMLDRVQGAQLAQRRFVSDASHELRSPLATLTATLEVAAADPTGAAWRDLRGVMTAETHRMSRLVEDLLLLARSDDAGLALRPEDVDLDDLVADEALRLRSAQAAEPGGAAVAVQVRATPVRVEGDPARLAQVLRNLADNAVRHATSTVLVELRADDDGRAVLAVEDDGPGIPVADRERVFDRFVRLDDSRERAKGGSGLGLAIVREVVRAHHGDVQVDDAGLGGCRVEVRLPRHQPAAQPPLAARR
ncbi:ATP-binding protein [Angustibacter peucedani]